MNHIATSRRSLLQAAGGAMVVGFVLGGAPPRGALAWTEKPVATDRVDAFLALDAQGGATIFVGKVDLGTGVRTGFLQIAAEELDLPLSRIRVVEGDTALTPDQGPTYGSLSIQNGGVQLRAAAATARRELLRLAAERLGAPAGELRVEEGTVVAPNGRRAGYAELIGGRSFDLAVDANAPIKPPEARRVVGRTVPRVDIPDKVFGRFEYVHDFRLPGMLHGRPVSQPAMGAVAEAVDEASVRDITRLGRLVR
jgi:CO/xanthine dehydrogenase Mo-binding subunit